MITTPEIKKIYANIQKQLFYLVPEKWDKIYLYASVTRQILNLETGELFFYYFPKGILKKNPVNVYEIPSKFSLNEEEYIKLVEKLYNTIKQLWRIYKFSNQKEWSSITIRLVGLKFEIEFNYEDFSVSNYSPTERHIIWKYKNLSIPLESFNKKDKKLIQEYLRENVIEIDNENEIYSEAIYKRPIKNLIDYNREKSQIQEDTEKEKYVTEAELLEKQAKQRFEEKRYTYTKKERKSLKGKVKKDKIKNEKEPTYVEQIEAQRNAVKSQILNHF